jgi:hypothetical protein
MKKFLVTVFCAMALAASQAANALTISLEVGAGGGGLTDHILGEVFQPGDLAGGLVVRDTAAVNGLLGVSLGTRTGTSPEYYRSSSDFGTLPAATGTGAIFAGSEGDMTVSGRNIQITLANAMTYLIATWDGPNAGAEVWYIGDIAAGTVIEIPRYAQPTDDGTPNWGHLTEPATGTQYGITTWTALNPITSVPDGGATATLLGSALFGLSMIARKFRKN